MSDKIIQALLNLTNSEVIKISDGVDSYFISNLSRNVEAVNMINAVWDIHSSCDCRVHPSKFWAPKWENKFLIEKFLCQIFEFFLKIIIG